jgi:hypothetical protein
MQAAINFGGLSAIDLLKRKTNILVLMRREIGKVSGNGKVELSALNHSTFEMGVATWLIKASTLQLSVSVW